MNCQIRDENTDFCQNGVAYSEIYVSIFKMRDEASEIRNESYQIGDETQEYRDEFSEIHDEYLGIHDKASEITASQSTQKTNTIH